MFHANGNTIKISASTASTNMSISAGSKDIMIGNGSTAWAFVNFGSSDVASTVPTTAASADGEMIPPGMSMFFTPGTAITYMSVALSSGTGDIYAAPGTLT